MARALQTAKAAIDKIKTNAQLTAAEKAAQKPSQSGKKPSASSGKKIALTASGITLGVLSCTYNGKAQQPQVTVRHGSVKLARNKDYTLTYKNNTGIGTASVVITGIGQYTGSVTKTFEILPPKTVNSSKPKAKSNGFTIKWKKEKSVSGYQIQYSTSKKFTKKTTVTKTVKKNTKTGFTVKNLKSKKKYYIRTRTYKKVKGVKYYSEWSKVKTVKVK